MNIKDINRANQIRQELHELEYFSDNINSRWKNTQMIVKEKHDVSFSILGSRFFGCGSHVKEVPVPKKLILYVDAAVAQLITQLEEELEKL
jgi:hypothetical protein